MQSISPIPREEIKMRNLTFERMKKSKSLLCILLIFLLSLFLTACGGGGSGSPDSVNKAEEAAPVAYKLIAADLNGDIWQLDENDGSSSELLDVYMDDGEGTRHDVGPVSAMVYDPATEKIYAGTDAGAECKGCIYAIDPSSGKATLFIVPGVNSIPDMAIRSDGKILASFEDFDNFLYEFDPSTADEPKYIGRLNAGTYGLGLSFSADDTLLLGQGLGLGIVNQDNGALASKGPLSFRNVPAFEKINRDFYPNYDNHIISEAIRLEDDQTFSIVNDVNSYYGQYFRYLVTVDPETVELTLVSEIDPTFDGIAFLPDNVISTSLEEASPPSNVVASSGPSCVSLMWDKVFSATYNIYRSSSPGVSPSKHEKKITGLTNTFYDIQGSEGESLYAVMTIVKNGVEGPPSDEVSALVGGSRGYQKIAFAPVTEPLANRVLLDDDARSDALPIGFSFNFFDRTYTEFVILSNGFISFDTTITDMSARRDSYYAHDLQVNDEWNNIIALAWADLSPNVELGGTISYETLGTAPNRRLVVSFEDVTYYGGSNMANVTTQSILYEGSNLVEIHTTYQDRLQDTDGEFQPGEDNITQGVENADGNEAYFVPGRVQSDYELNNDAVRFYTNL